MTNALESVLEEAREDAVKLRLHGHTAQAASIEHVVARITDAMGDYLDWLTEDEAALQSGRSVNWLRGRFAEWESTDKAQWVDEATGLDCLIVRGPSGALCGYVGVAPGHPWHGKDYSQCLETPVCEESWCGHSAGSRLEVHGGITFADSCHEPTREAWEQWRERMKASKDEAERFPVGDAARRLRTLGHFMDDFEGWKAHGEASFICHIPGPGRPKDVWWFGFDCAHSGPTPE